MRIRRMAFAAAALAALTAPGAHAALTDSMGSIGSPHTITFDEFDALVTVGPTQVGDSVGKDVVFTASTLSTLGAYVADLGSNGTWGAGKIFAATGFIPGAGDPVPSEPLPIAPFGLLHYTFTDMVTKGAGAVLNAFDGGPILLIAYGVDTTILEAHVVSVSTPMGFNEGSFYGIVRPSADIRAIAFGGTGLVMDDLTFTTPVPEPETWAMMFAGLALVGWVAGRRRRVGV